MFRAGRLLWPFLANLMRLVIAAGGGYLALRFSGNVTGVFIALAVALCAFGLINAAAVAGGSWSNKPPRSSRKCWQSTTIWNRSGSPRSDRGPPS